MRRNNQALAKSDCCEILQSATSGVLSVHGENGYPYGVPISFVYDNGKIYFHSALSGHKIDSIKNNQKVSFCVIADDNVQPEIFTTLYKSVIIFGNAKIITDEAEKERTILLLAEKYSYGISPTTELEKYKDKFLMIEITINEISGKQAKELITK